MITEEQKEKDIRGLISKNLGYRIGITAMCKLYFKQ